MSCFTKEQQSKISNLVKEIEQLSDIEKLSLYLQLPCGQTELSEGKLRSNGKHHLDLLSKKPDQETTQTYTWILSHLEEDPSVSLPKQEVYDEYKGFCQVNEIEPLCVADFGKAMKHAFPCIKPRRLGQRGNSKYCYSGLRKKYKIQPPSLPDLIDSSPTSYRSDNNFQQSQHSFNHQQLPTIVGETNFSPTPRSKPHQLLSEIPATLAPNPTNLIPMDIHPPRVNYSCCEAINLKIGPADSHHHHHHYPNQQQHHHLQAPPPPPSAQSISQHNQHHHSTMSTQHCSNSNGTNNPYAPTIHHSALEQHKIDPSNTDNTAQDRGGVNHQAQPIPITDTQTSLDVRIPGPSGSSLDQQQQSHIIYGQQRSIFEYPGTNQRFGTPDDDDYDHNYQDLNRPIVGEVFQFTQQQQQQAAVTNSAFMYEQTQVTNQSLAQHNHSQNIQHTHSLHLTDPLHHQHLQHQQHQHHMPLSPSNKSAGHHLSSRLRLNLSLPVASKSNATSPTTSMTGSPKQQHPLVPIPGSSSNGQVHSNEQNHSQYNSNGGNSSSGSSTSCNNNGTSHPHLQNLHLSNICVNNGSSCYSNRMNSSSIDCCASPFQSPASTPYPMMGDFSTQDVPNYSSDCMGYSEQ